MASSQVEIALTSPFGCVLRKYNHRDRFRESTSSRVSSSSQVTTFQNNNDRRSGFVVVDNACNNNSVAVAPQIDAVNNNNNNVILNDAAAAKKEKEDESSSSSSSLSSPNNNNVNPRQSQILDRWAARKAKEMVSTIETEAELLENLGSSTTSSPSSETLNNNNNNRGASSLVQIWERRLNTNSLNLSLKCNNTTTSRTSSLGSSDVGEIFTDETSSSSSCSDCVTSDTNEATCSTPKVADIIKRLKENNYGQDQCGNSNNNNLMMMMMGSSPSTCLSSREQGQRPNVVLHHVASSPRLRGRRALTDLLMQIERDRNGELNNLTQLAPVSNFSQRGRGRIQSLLRLRLLKRHHESRSINEVKRQPKGSTIMHLRERFNFEAKKQRNVIQPETASSSGNHPDQPENPLPPHNPSSDEHYGLNPIGLDRVVNVTNGHQNDNDHCVASDEQPESSSPRHEEEAHHASSSSESNLEAQNNVNAASSSSQEISETSGCNMVDSSGYANHETKDGEADVAEAKQDDNNSAETEIIEEEEDHEEYASVGNDDHDEQNYEDDEHYYDWISPIARPRSYWEDRRQAWYKEMLDTASSDNKLEIRQLLQRRTVSSFLSSEFRERMDKLMEFHIGTQTEFISSQEDDEENGGTMGQLISFLQQHIQCHNINGHHHNLEQEQEAAEKQEEEEEEEEGSLSNGSYTTETNDDQSSSSSSSTQILTSSSSPNMSSSSWSYRDNETSDESSTSSSSTQPSHPSHDQSFYQYTLQSSSSSSSSINPHSMEMDLICEMRGQMEQVYREMAEIRKSLKSCIDMQMMLQTSMKREVNTALKRERKKEEKKEKKKESKEEKKKENCCICYEKKVDSVLYRCGHMCACVKCANELQWNSGKCPICRAPIGDVVRVYVDA